MPDIYSASKENILPKDENASATLTDNFVEKPKNPSLSDKQKDIFSNLKNGKLIRKIAEKISIGNALASFAAYPKGVRFQTQEEKEEIILLLRRHVITNLLWIMIAVVLFFLPLLFSPFFYLFIPIKIPLNYQIISLIVWYSMIASSVMINFFVWYYNVYIITDQRIIDVDFYSLTYKKISSATLDNVQDITIRAGGILRVIFDFADIDIQTAGTVPNFTFEAVPHPDVIAREIHDLLDDYKMYINKDNYESK